MPYSDSAKDQVIRSKWRKRVNSKSLDTAKKHRDDWTAVEVERIMDDDVCEVPHVGRITPTMQSLTVELGRTWQAISCKRHEIKGDMEKELSQFESEGPVIPVSEETEEQKRNYAKALRIACTKLTCSSIRTTEHKVGSEDHQYELMELYAMMGLME